VAEAEASGLCAVVGQQRCYVRSAGLQSPVDHSENMCAVEGRTGCYVRFAEQGGPMSVLQAVTGWVGVALVLEAVTGQGGLSSVLEGAAVQDRSK
jgi:hypothetical protein